MNILLIVKNMEHQNGGVCTHILALAKAYKKLGHRVFLVADGSDYDDSISKLKINYINNIGLKSINKNPVTFLQAYLKIKKLCKESDIDIIHLHTQSAIPLAALIKKKIGIPYIWTNHINDIPQPQLLKLFHKIFKFPVISVSESLKYDLIERLHINQQYISVINNGIDLEDFLRQVDKKEIRERLAINEDDYNICIVARIAYNKGHDILVKALKKVQDSLNKDISINLVISGDIQDKEWFNNSVLSYAESNNIRFSFVGFQNAYEVFSVCNLFVLPSRKEGFPMSCIEALAAHCPVIRTKTPGWIEMQDYCDVVEIDDLDGLANIIKETILDNKRLLTKTENGYREVLRKFNSMSMAQETIEIYKKQINE